MLIAVPVSLAAFVTVSLVFGLSTAATIWLAAAAILVAVFVKTLRQPTLY